LVFLLFLLTDVSLFSIAVVSISHLLTLAYSTVSTGLLGANLRYVEAISEPSSRFFALIIGTLSLVLFEDLRNEQFVLFIHASADVFMFICVFYFYYRASRNFKQKQEKEAEIAWGYRFKSLLNAGAMNTMGVGETWALSARSSLSDFGFYGLISRVVDTAGLVASYAGYSQLPVLVKNLHENNWRDLAVRCQRLLILSLAPTLVLSFFVLWAGHKNFVVLGYDIGENWAPLLVYVCSVPAIVLSKYLVLLLQSLEPGKSMNIVLVVGTSVTLAVFFLYPSFGLTAVFLTMAFANYARALFLFQTIRRMHDRIIT
jgi:O-antigen/teichoic acid export membrane protein